LAGGKENNNPFCQQVSVTLVASASLNTVGKNDNQELRSSTLDNDSLLYYLWIFFAFPIEP